MRSDNSQALLWSLLFAATVAALTFQACENEPGNADSEGRLFAGQVAQNESHRAPGSRLLSTYDPDPQNIVNRLFNQFYVRTARSGEWYGGDVLEPLLWPETEYLLSGESHQQAMAVLDEFLSHNSEVLTSNPLKRALLQRDLWAVFDWVCDSDDRHPAERKELARKLADAIQRLALTSAQIRSLPDTYSAAIASGAFPVQYDGQKPGVAFLPPDLFQQDGPWVSVAQLGSSSGAPDHTQFFEGRSAFLVYLSLPGGRPSTLAYLQKLKDFPQPLVPNSGPYTLLGGPVAGVGTNAPFVLNPDLPQFPSGTRVALVRRMMLINDRGEIMSTAIAESVQLRVFSNIPPRAEWLAGKGGVLEDVFEFRLSRSRLFAGLYGGLRAVTPNDREFTLFHSHGIDPFEEGPSSIKPEPILDSCAGCHNAPGIHSILAMRLMRGGQSGPNSFPGLWAISGTWAVSAEQDEAISEKHRQYSWGLLQGLWK